MPSQKPSTPLSDLQLLDIDMDYLQQVLGELLDIPSPTGRTDHVQQYVGERLAALGMDFSITRRGRPCADSNRRQESAGSAPASVARMRPAIAATKPGSAG